MGSLYANILAICFLVRKAKTGKLHSQVASDTFSTTKENNTGKRLIIYGVTLHYRPMQLYFA